ncbi:MAG: WxcM-like domain-containing protein [Clostridiaceae bacterium]|nr:WxcM-like domain-containing protein [Clostridiaceae bacterium]
MKNISIDKCRIIDLKKINNRSGNITIAENDMDLPFGVKRIFYIYDIPGGEDRGAHAHIECHQFLIAASGSFEVEVDDGVNKKTFSLKQPSYGLHVPPGIWAAEKNFSSGAVCLVLASHKFEEKDYIRDYKDFKKYKKQ